MNGISYYEVSANNHYELADKIKKMLQKKNMAFSRDSSYSLLYSGIGRNKLRSITDREDCDFVLWVGSKRLIKRKLLDKFIDESYSIQVKAVKCAIL